MPRWAVPLLFHTITADGAVNKAMAEKTGVGEESRIEGSERGSIRGEGKKVEPMLVYSCVSAASSGKTAAPSKITPASSLPTNAISAEATRYRRPLCCRAAKRRACARRRQAAGALGVNDISVFALLAHSRWVFREKKCRRCSV